MDLISDPYEHRDDQLAIISAQRKPVSPNDDRTTALDTALGNFNYTLLAVELKVLQTAGGGRNADVLSKKLAVLESNELVFLRR